MMQIDWFTLLIASGILMSIIAVLTILEAACYKHYCTDYTIVKAGISFNNYVIVKYDHTIVKKNTATEYAKAVLIKSLITDKHDSIRQHIPVIFYSSNNQDITDKFEYHSLIESKTLAVAIRVMLVNNSPEYLHIAKMVVKSNENNDLFILDTDINIQPYQRLYIIWYIQIAGENVTEAGISQMLTALAYADTQYKHNTIKDIVLLDSSGNVLPLYLLYSEWKYREGDREGNDNNNNNNPSITGVAYFKNNTPKTQNVKTIAVRNNANEYIFAYDLEEEMILKPYSKMSVKVIIQ